MVKEIKQEASFVPRTIKVKKYYYGKVGKGNSNCSRIYLPKHLEGKHVYIVEDIEK